MRFSEFATHKPKKPRTPQQALVAARKREAAITKQALQSVKDNEKQRREAERAIRASYIAKLK